MLKLLLIENDLKNIHILINILGDVFYNKIVVSKLCMNSIEVAEIENMNSYDILIINDNNVGSLNIHELLKDIDKDRTDVIIISDEQHISKNITVHVTNNMYGAINILNNLYTKLNIQNKHIEKFLNIFEFNKSSHGYKYIIDLLDICIDEKYSYVPALNKLYDKIALKYENATSKNIGWNIEKTLNKMKLMTESKIIDKYFGFPPSPKIFLEAILDMYNNNENNQKTEI